MFLSKTMFWWEIIKDVTQYPPQALFIKKNHVFYEETSFYKKEMLRVLSKGLFFKTCSKHAWTTAAVFPRGFEKRKSNNDDKQDHGKEKGDPQHYVEGKTS